MLARSTTAAYEDAATKFFEHFVAITHAMNTLGGSGLWDEQDGFYYDQMHQDGRSERLRVRSMVGLIPLFAVEVLPMATIRRLPGFEKRLRWFLEADAVFGQDVLRVGQHVHQVADRRALVTGDVGDAGFQQRLRHCQNAFAAEALAFAQTQLLDFFDKRTFSHGARVWMRWRSDASPSVYYSEQNLFKIMLYPKLSKRHARR